MKKIELGNKAYAELKDGVTFGCLLQASDLSVGGKQSEPLLAILVGLISKLVIDDKEVTAEEMKEKIMALDAKVAMPLMTEASKVLQVGFGGLGEEQKKE